MDAKGTSPSLPGSRSASRRSGSITAPKPEPIGPRYVCMGCGYEYVPELGDPDGDAAPGTLFEKLPEGWVCPECAEARDQFIEA